MTTGAEAVGPRHRSRLQTWVATALAALLICGATTTGAWLLRQYRQHRKYGELRARALTLCTSRPQDETTWKAVRNAAQDALATGFADAEVKDALQKAGQALAPQTYTISGILKLENRSRGFPARKHADQRDTFSIEARPGDALLLTTDGRLIRFPVTANTPHRLHFEVDGPWYRLNNRRVGIELEGPGARRWLAQAPLKELADLRYLCVGALASDDRQALTRLSPRPLAIDVTIDHFDAIAPVLPNLAPTVLGLDMAPESDQWQVLATVPNLRVLRIANASGLSDLAPLADLQELRTLELHGTPRLSDLSPLSGLHHLTALILTGTRGLRDLSPLLALANLEVLVLQSQEQARDLRALRRLPNLRHLTVSLPAPPQPLLSQIPWLESFLAEVGAEPPAPVTSMAALSHLPRLESLTLLDSEALRNLSPLRTLPRLRHLDLAGSESVTDLTPLTDLPALQTLDLTDCHSVSDLTPLRALPRLRRLSLANARGIHSIAPLAALEELEILDLSNLRLRHLGVLGQLPRLHSLKLTQLNTPAQLPPPSAPGGLYEVSLPPGTDNLVLARLCREHPRLRDLTVFSDAALLNDLSPLTTLENLQNLHLLDASGVADFRPLGRISSLRRLLLYQLETKDLDFVRHLPRLQSLQIVECEALSDLSGLTAHPRLRHLDLYDAAAVEDIVPLGTIRTLADLTLQGSHRLSDLTPLATLPRLTALNLMDCPRVTDLAPLQKIPHLTWLWIRSYTLAPSQLRKLPKCRIMGE